MVRGETVPDVSNYSCWTSMFQHPQTPSAGDIVKAVISSIIGVLVFVVNVIFIIAINGKHNTKHMSFQPRYLLTSLALGDLLKAVVVVPLSVYPTLYHCWPYPAILCAPMALLLPLLHHQAALTLSMLALDRYCCILHPTSYHSCVNRPVCVFMVVLSWCLTAGLQVALYLPTPDFFFNHISNQSCEPYHTANSQIIMVACAVYFPTTMVTMYCYGTVFHVARTSLHRLVRATVHAPEIIGGAVVEKVLVSERRQSMRNCRVMAVVSLSFIILITPWTLRQIIAACTNSKVPGGLDYGVWVVNLTSGVIITFIFWLLSHSFRMATEHALHNRVCCGNVYYDDSDDVTFNQLAPPPPPPPPPVDHLLKMDVFHHPSAHTSACPAAHASTLPSMANSKGSGRTPALSCNATPRHLVNGRPPAPPVRQTEEALDIEEIGEKYWGEILERAVSSSSLQNLQRIYRNGSTAHPDLRLDQASNYQI